MSEEEEELMPRLVSLGFGNGAVLGLHLSGVRLTLKIWNEAGH